jgi:hypothetical protein
MTDKTRWNWSWLRILRVVSIASALATGAPTLVRDFILLRSGSPASAEANYWSWLRICAVVSFIVAWFQEHQIVRGLEEKLRTRLVIPKKLYEQPYKDGSVSYYFDVVNGSEAATTTGVEVKLVEINPPVPGLAWFPIPLQVKHDVRTPRMRTFDLNPQDKKQIDLVFGPAGTSGIHITDVITDSTTWTGIPNGKYTLTVEATGKDTPPARARFDVWRDETGYLRCAVSEQEGLPDEQDASRNTSSDNSTLSKVVASC